MTISMLALAGIPATAGFTGKFYLIDASVSGGYTWLGVVIVIGSMISLGYYLPVIAAMWMREAPSGRARRAPTAPRGEGPTPAAGELPALAGGSPELDPPPGPPGGAAGGAPGQLPEPLAPERRWPELGFVAVIAAAGTVFFGIIPQPLFDLVEGVARGWGLF
jgi:NADH-quinone oxidoreductase subunit N